MAWIIYAMGILDNFEVLISATWVVALLGCLVCMMLIFSETSNTNEKRVLKWAAAVLIISSVLCLFVPSSRTVAAMYIVPKLAENGQLERMPEKIMNVLEKKLDNWSKDVVK